MKKIFLWEGVGKKQHQTELFTLVDDCDFQELNKNRWFLMKIYHTENKINYVRRYDNFTSNGKRIIRAVLMHRVILGLTDKSEKADHINGEGLDNQRANLRKTTHSQNMSNRIKRAGDSVYLGVTRTRYGRWTVKTSHNLIKHRVPGVFISEDVAGLKYNELVTKIKGENTRLNVIRWY